MKMKKIFAAFVVLFVNLAFVQAFEWGGLFENNSNYTYSVKQNFVQSNGIYLWLKTPLSDDGKFNFTAEGLYKFSDVVTISKNPKSDFTNVLDVDLFKFDGAIDCFNGSLNFKAGRFFTAENSGVVFAQTSDGIDFSFKNQKIGLSVYGGYTGLLNSLNVFMTEKNPDSNYSQLYNLCAAFVPVSAQFALYNLGDFSTSVQGDYFISLNDKIKNRAYASLNVNGALSTFGTLNFNFVAGTYDFTSIMLFSNLDLNLFAGDSFIFGAGCEYGSGTNAEKNIAAFNPVTMRSVYSGLRPIKEDYISPRLSGTLVLNNFYAKLTEKTVVELKDGADIFGSDTVLDLKYNIFSDLQIGCNGSLYFDFSDKKYNKYSVSLNAALEF